jgi:Domain of unknown function (DUF4160)
MEEPDLASLQNDLAMVDMRTRPQRKKQFGLLEALLIKKDQIKLKMYQEKGHARPHFHVDYGSQNHAASYAIDTGERLDGVLDRKYDKAVGSWAESNRQQLLNVWDAMQAGKPEQSFIASLSALD